MKKILAILSLVFSIMFVNGCASKNIVKTKEKNAVPKETKVALTIKDYFSLKGNTEYVYEGKGNEYAAYHAFVDYLANNRAQIRIRNGGTEIVKVLEYKEGSLTILLSREECYYRENFTQSKSISSNPEVLLKEPLIKGTSWTLADNRKRYISNVDVEVTTPSGNYKTLEVTTEGKGDKTLDYYAQNVGLVKSVFISNGNEITSCLSKIEKNTLLSQTVKFYYPNVNENKLYFVNKELSFNTNDITKSIIEKAYKELPKGNIARVLSPNTKIISLYLNKDNIVYVDFTKEFVTEMNAGSGYETMVLQSITNTLGKYYGAEKVYITVEGNPYTSSHIIMKKGESFTVNTKYSAELK